MRPYFFAYWSYWPEPNGLFDVFLLAGKEDPSGGTNYQSFPPSLLLPPQQQWRQQLRGCLWCLRELPSPDSSQTPDRAKRAVAATAAGLAAGGWAAVSSPLRTLTAWRTCICRVLLSVSSLEYPHDLMAWRIFTFTAGSGFCLQAKKKRAAFATRESLFLPFLFEDIWRYGNESQ